MALRLLFSWLLCFGLWAQDTVVVFLRHAEKSSKRTNAQLNEAGRGRAKRLGTELAAFHPVGLFASNLRRTQQTLEPLADQLRLPIQFYDRGAEAALAETLLERFSGRTVVVCGHSDALMILVAGLGYRESFPEINGFDRIWILRVPPPPGVVTLEERRQAPE
jgi:broad specificity phosphatase PhoE